MEGIVTFFGSNYKVTYYARVMEKGISRRREDVEKSPAPSRRRGRIQEGLTSPNASEASVRGRRRKRESSPMFTTSVRFTEDQRELLKFSAKEHKQTEADELRDALANHFWYVTQTEIKIRKARDGIVLRRNARIIRDSEEGLGR